jgi:hypothetical protein
MSKNNRPQRGGGPQNTSKAQNYEAAQKKPVRPVIISTPFTERIVKAAVDADIIFSRISSAFGRGIINGQQFMQAQVRLDGAIKALEGEIHAIENHSRPRNRQNRPAQKPPKVIQIKSQPGTGNSSLSTVAKTLDADVLRAEAKVSAKAPKTRAKKATKTASR